MTETQQAIEAILMVAEEPVPAHLLAQVLEVAPAAVDAACAELAAAYETEGRGFQLAKVAGGYRFQSHPEQAPYVERFVLEGQSARLSAAALETLAIIAYRQPIGRSEIEEIRGVGAGAILKSLHERGLIDIVGRGEGLGRPLLYGTTSSFLEQFALRHLEELPRADELAIALRAPRQATPTSVAVTKDNGEGPSRAD